MLAVRPPRPAVIATFCLITLVLWTAWLSKDQWGETWELPPVKLPPKTPEPEARPEESTTTPTSAYRISKLHYLIPTTAMKPGVCASIASALLNRYSIPTIVGYKGKGKYDAKAAHIAKLRTASRYLHNVKNALDDDLVMIVDGFDVIAQLPAAATIQLYFDMIPVANQRVADRHGLSLKEAREKGFYETLLWGTDKGCFPSRREEPQCWLIPEPPSPHNIWGPMTDNGELPFSPSKFLNSGTVIGPLGDLRTFIDATLKFINETWDPEHPKRDSDQLYISKMYARQEFHRNIDLLQAGESYPGAGGDRTLPKKRVDENDLTEFHVTVDFESGFAQTHCHNDRFLHKLMYNNWDNSALMKHDVLDEGEGFKPYHIPMPSYINKSLLRIFNSLEKSQRPVKNARDWVRSLRLGTNVATRRIYAIYHSTCLKKGFVERFQDFWFFPAIDALLKAATQENRRGNPISEEPIDGRMWVDSQHHPQESADPEGYGGVFTDLEGESYLSFREACGEYWEEIFNRKLPKWEAPSAREIEG